MHQIKLIMYSVTHCQWLIVQHWQSSLQWFLSSSTCLFSPLLFSGIQVIEVGVTFSVILVQKFTMIIASLVIAFIINWKLALVLSCLLPFLLMFSYFLVKVSEHGSGD